MKYQLPEIKEYTEERYVRATEFMFVPSYRIEELNKRIATEFASAIESAIKEGEPYEEKIYVYEQLYNEIVQDIIYDFLEQDGVSVEEVIDSCEETIYEQDKDIVVLTDDDGKTILEEEGTYKGIYTDNNENN